MEHDHIDMYIQGVQILEQLHMYTCQYIGN